LAPSHGIAVPDDGPTSISNRAKESSMKFTSEYLTAAQAFVTVPQCDYENEADFGKGWYRVCRAEDGAVIWADGPFSKAGISTFKRR